METRVLPLGSSHKEGMQRFHSEGRVRLDTAHSGVLFSVSSMLGLPQWVRVSWSVVSDGRSSRRLARLSSSVLLPRSAWFTESLALYLICTEHLHREVACGEELR